MHRTRGTASLLSLPRPPRCFDGATCARTHIRIPELQDSGVRFSDGDGTVPLVSLGLMPRKGWKTRRLNPGGIRIVTHELKHVDVPLLQSPR